MNTQLAEPKSMQFDKTSFARFYLLRASNQQPTFWRSPRVACPAILARCLYFVRSFLVCLSPIKKTSRTLN